MAPGPRTTFLGVIALTALLSLGLPAPPASASVHAYANPGSSYHIHQGTLTVYELLTTTPVATWTFGTAPCTTAESIAFDDVALTYTATSTLTFETRLTGGAGSATHLVELTISYSGDYQVPGPPFPHPLAGTASVTADFRTLTGPCTAAGAVVCSLHAVNIVQAGTLNEHGNGVGGLGGGHRFVGDHLFLGGSNIDAEVVTTGAGCGPLTLANDGSAELGFLGDDF